MVVASFTLALLLALRDREMAGDTAAARIDPGRAAVDDRAASIEVDRQPRPVDAVLFAIELHVAEQGDQLPVEVVDAEVSARRLRRALDDDPAGRIEPLDLNARASVAARIS